MKREDLSNESQLAAANKIQAQARRRSVSTTRAATKIASMARFRAARNHALRLRCKNDVDLSLDPLTPGQRTFRLQQGQCLTLKDAMGLWMMAADGGGWLVPPRNPYTRDPFDPSDLHDFIMDTIFEVAPLRLIDEWLQKIIQYIHRDLVEVINEGTNNRYERELLQRNKDYLNEMINFSEHLQRFLAARVRSVAAGRAAEWEVVGNLKRQAWHFITRHDDDIILNVIQDFWKYTEGNYEFVHGVETRRVRQMLDNLL